MVVARVVWIGEKCANAVAATNITVLGLSKVTRQEAKRKRVSVVVVRRQLQLAVCAPHAIVAQEHRAGTLGQLLNIDHRGGAVLPVTNVPNCQSAGQHYESMRFRRCNDGKAS